jgi:conjugative relaxase-like TrwC/TraI family protein
MLSHKVVSRQNVGEVVHYYEDGVDDYYTRQGDGSVWQGRGAEALGLRGKVKTSRFHELLRGEVDPAARSSRTATRRDSHNRLAIDLTFSAPKSVSLQALVHGDPRIVRAHDRAVAHALEVAERLAEARHKVDGSSRVERTENLIVAKFRHETSRAQDPQLHTHAIVMNLTQRKDGSWRALRNDPIVKSTKFLGAEYRTSLAAQLKDLGYELRHGREGMFELAHVSHEQLQRFSQRAKDIERQLAKHGVERSTATTAQKQIAALATRERKAVVGREAIRQQWRTRAAEYGIDFTLAERRSWRTREPDKEPLSASSAVTAAAARRGVRYALNHLTERQAIVTRNELIRTAMNHVTGSADSQAIESELRQLARSGYLVPEVPTFRRADAPDSARARPRTEWVRDLVASGVNPTAARVRVDTEVRLGVLLRAEPRYTTQTALQRERRILRMEREGRGVLTPILPPVNQASLNGELTAGQRHAVLAIATTSNRVIGVQGLAGTGKSHMLREAKAVVNSAGHEMIAVAPYSSQGRAMRELGMEARTVASFLAAKDKHLDARSTLVVDEAGTVPTRQMEELLRVAQERGARVVLLGDTRQTRAIEAGRPFDQLQERGMETVTMSEIQRQRDPELRRAVELAATGKAGESLSHIRDVRQISDDEGRRRAVAEDFTRLSEEERSRTLIVTGTNDARREITQVVREELKLAGRGQEYATLTRVDTTREERRFSLNYEVGAIIQPEREYPRFNLKRGELYTVTDTGPGNRLTVRDERGAILDFSPKLVSELSVYSPEVAEFTPGDRVRVTRNDAQRDLANGDRFRVLKVSPETVYLTDEHRVISISSNRPLHLEHAYATTVHSAQGVTADRVLYDACTRSRTTADDVYYVAISRARRQVTIYTDNASRLPAAISRKNTKHAALDLTRGREGRQASVHGFGA